MKKKLFTRNGKEKNIPSVIVPLLYQNIWWKRYFSFQLSVFHFYMVSLEYSGSGGHGRQFKQKCEKKKLMKIGRMTIIIFDRNLVTWAARANH